MLNKVLHWKNRKQKKQSVKNILLVIFSFFVLFTILGGVYIWYQSRAIPDLDEQNQVTLIPTEFQHVLGSKTGPNISKETQLRVPIFLYHYVEPPPANDPGRQNLNIPPSVLASQIETLKGAGYTFVTAEELTEAVLGKKKLPQNLAMLTFDDGYQDFYNYVYPVLQKENVKAVFYIVPNFLDRPNYLYTYELKVLAKSPLIEIGAHTMNHVWLKDKNLQTVTYEISQSRKVLQDLLHLPINSFAYPYGAFDQQAVAAVTAAGFTNAMSTVPGITQNSDNRYFFYRLRPGYRSGKTLLNYLQQDNFQPW